MGDGHEIRSAPSDGAALPTFAVQRVVRRRVFDVRDDAVVVGARSRDPVELAFGQLELAAVGRRQCDQGLHGALAEGAAANDQTEIVVLDRAREDLGSGGRTAVHHHRQRAVPHGGAVLVAEHARSPAQALDLDHGPGAHEQAGQFHRFLERAAAVAAHVDDQSVHALALEFLDEPGHVAGRALVARIALFHGLEVRVEGGNDDDADAVLATVPGHLEHRLACRLLHQADRLADDLHHPRLLLLGDGRNDLESYQRTLGAADHLHDFVRAHADDVDERTLVLRDPDDAILGLQAATLVGRTAFDQVANDGVFVFRAQMRPDALQGQRHVDSEVLGILGREILGMFVVGRREGVDEALEYVLAAGLANGPGTVVDPFRQGFVDVLGRISGELGREHAVLHVQPPKILERGPRLRPRRLRAVDDGLVDREVELLDALLDQVGLELDAFQGALPEGVVDGERGFEVALPQSVVEIVAIPFESGDVGGEKVQPSRVEETQVVVEGLAGNLVVERLANEVPLAQAIHDVDAGLAMGRQRFEIIPIAGLKARIGDHCDGERRCDRQGRCAGRRRAEDASCHDCPIPRFFHRLGTMVQSCANVPHAQWHGQHRVCPCTRPIFEATAARWLT